MTAESGSLGPQFARSIIDYLAYRLFMRKAEREIRPVDLPATFVEFTRTPEWSTLLDYAEEMAEVLLPIDKSSLTLWAAFDYVCGGYHDLPFQHHRFHGNFALHEHAAPPRRVSCRLHHREAICVYSAPGQRTPPAFSVRDDHQSLPQ